MKDPIYRPMKLKELAVFFDIPRERRNELKEVLDALLEEGKISISTKGKYGRADSFAIQGTFSGNPRGFGFVSVDGMEQDVFIAEDKTKGALHGDRVSIVIENENSGRRPEGRVVKILEHANETVVGFFQKNKSFGFVIPDNPKIQSDIFISGGKEMGAVQGHKVVAKITDFGDGLRKKPEGEIIEILGHVNDPGVDILSIVRAFGLPEAFPAEVLREAEQIESIVSSKETAGRKDLRAVQMVTIDGEDAKDLDDAVSLTKEDGIYHLGVHIADVSHYVKENRALDEEARRRGTSVYLVDRVIPMLPHRLSNGICSLNAGEDRLAL
ncbi:MAG: RNB domain-containing ribonuclease, partial [bacterium]|nr:RNB domain-containing ribonuclease [bacterium]